MIDFYFTLPDGLRALIITAFVMLATFLISEFVLKKIPRDHRYVVFDPQNKKNKIEIKLDPAASEQERQRIYDEAVATLDARSAASAHPGN